MRNAHKNWLIVFSGTLFFFFGLHLGQANSSSPPDNTPPLPSPLYDHSSYSQLVERNLEACSDDNCRWWYDYVSGKLQLTTDTKAACDIFTQLSEKPEFPLHLLALSRRAETCTYDSTLSLKTLGKIKDAIAKEKLRPWLEGVLSEAGLRAAIQSPPGTATSDIFDFSLAASHFSHSKKLRIEYLQKSIEATKEITNPDLIEKRSNVEQELYRISPRLKPVTEADDNAETWYGNAADCFSLHDFSGAVTGFEKALKFKQAAVPLRRLAFENLKASYKALQKKTDAFDVTKKLYFWELSIFKGRRPPSDEAKHVLNSGLGYAKFLWTDHESKKALGFLNKLEKVLKKSQVNLSELFFVRARIKEELRQSKSAFMWMKKAIENAEPAVKGQYGWTAAWLNYKENKFDLSQEQLEELLVTETDNGRRSQEMFWLGKSYEHLNNPEQKQYWLEKLIQEDPLSYYSLIAYRELHRPIPKTTAFDFGEASKIPRQGDAPPKTLTPLFQWLVSLGEIHWAQEMLEDEFPLPEPSDQIGENLFQAYAEADFFAPIFNRINKAPPAEKEKILSKHPEFIFPRTFKSAVDGASGQSGISAGYIFSIMRQESSFDPLAVSPANAYGLLQLLPSVAASLAAKSGAPYHKPEDLLDPDLNIILGSQHLRNYWEEFDGQFVLSTAAYNASPETVKTWVRARYQGDPLKFIEDIPYDETRVYVKLVLRNFINYMRLDSSEPTIGFPEWCLEGIHASKD